MNGGVKSAVFFAAGLLTGGIFVWRYTKAKYEKILQDEIDSVKAVFSKKKQTCPSEQADENPDFQNYSQILKARKYTNYSNAKEEKEESDLKKPYVIAPEEFGVMEGYETLSLTYYADEVLMDDSDEPIDDVDNIVGLESLTHFGEYEDDSVFVRNDELKCDYEILRDDRVSSDVG